VHAIRGCARFDDDRPKTWHMIFPVRCGAGIDAGGPLELMKFFGNERPDPVRPLLQAVVEVTPTAARGQAVGLLNRYDMLKHTRCSSTPASPCVPIRLVRCCGGPQSTNYWPRAKIFLASGLNDRSADRVAAVPQSCRDWLRFSGSGRISLVGSGFCGRTCPASRSLDGVPAPDMV
jgi:hypothetical protein